jgi:hypothetical protein
MNGSKSVPELASGFVLGEIGEYSSQVDSDVPCQPRLNIAIVCVLRSGQRRPGMRFNCETRSELAHPQDGHSPDHPARLGLCVRGLPGGRHQDRLEGRSQHLWQVRESAQRISRCQMVYEERGAVNEATYCLSLAMWP